MKHWRYVLTELWNYNICGIKFYHNYERFYWKKRNKNEKTKIKYNKIDNQTQKQNGSTNS